MFNPFVSFNACLCSSRNLFFRYFSLAKRATLTELAFRLKLYYSSMSYRNVNLFVQQSIGKFKLESISSSIAIIRRHACDLP